MLIVCSSGWNWNDWCFLLTHCARSVLTSLFPRVQAERRRTENFQLIFVIFLKEPQIGWGQCRSSCLKLGCLNQMQPLLSGLLCPLSKSLSAGPWVKAEGSGDWNNDPGCHRKPLLGPWLAISRLPSAQLSVWCRQETWNKGVSLKLVKAGVTWKALVSRCAVGTWCKSDLCTLLLWALEKLPPYLQGPVRREVLHMI